MELFGLDKDRVWERINFLEWRAAQHEKAEAPQKKEPTPREQLGQRLPGPEPSREDLRARRRDERELHLAAAATCLRDAGDLALVLGDGALARDLFRRAGKHYSEIGLFSGRLLLELSREEDPQRWPEDRTGDFSRLLSEARAQLDDGEETSGTREEPGKRAKDLGGGWAEEDEEGDFKAGLWSSPEEVLHLYQSLALDRDEVPDDLLHAVRSVLRRWEGVQIGASDIPLATYMAVLDPLLELEPPEERRPFPPERALEAILLRRRERLEQARADIYHWTTLLAPIDILDLDVLCLCVIAQKNKLLNEVRRRIEDEDHDGLTLLPVERARLLRPFGPRSGPTPEGWPRMEL